MTGRASSNKNKKGERRVPKLGRLQANGIHTKCKAVMPTTSLILPSMAYG